ncbi:S41 family peptidase [Photobacterium kishitanii]|uniref:Tail specific protease domain-containing protein n=1 Tax=Photobacterium kishitanii TaxID=318456 RepID=A0A2T3KAX7_9GAMM|nr:S41 family peptidase [Photobacterium kishitanii]PSU89776.1 hypothetical protein C9J27_24145 [Photobacterium kishitanii]
MKRRILNIIAIGAISFSSCCSYAFESPKQAGLEDLIATNHYHNMQNVKEGSPHAFTYESLEDNVDSVLANIAFYHYPVIPFFSLKMHTIEATSKALNVSFPNNKIDANLFLSNAKSIDELIAGLDKISHVASSLKLPVREYSLVLIRELLSFKSDIYTRFKSNSDIDVSTSSSRKKVLDIDKDTHSNYIKIESFNRKQCSIDTRDNNNIIIDLRDNGGGNMACTLEAIGSLLKKGKHHVGNLETNDFTKPLWTNGTIKEDANGTILVNKNTASSAEFFMYVMKNRGWRIVGGNTYGKVVTQYRFRSALGEYFITFGRYIPL